MNNRYTAAAAVMGLVSLGTAFCLAAPMATVTQFRREFNQSALSVAAGTVLRFENRDDFPHQVSVAGPGLDFESNLQDPGEVVLVTLPRAGVFEVRCGIHPRMRLTVRTTTP